MPTIKATITAKRAARLLMRLPSDVVLIPPKVGVVGLFETGSDCEKPGSYMQGASKCAIAFSATNTRFRLLRDENRVLPVGVLLVRYSFF